MIVIGLIAVRYLGTVILIVADPIPVLIRITIISDAVFVGIDLIPIGEALTVVDEVFNAVPIGIAVAGVTDSIAVLIALVGIGYLRAVVIAVLGFAAGTRMVPRDVAPIPILWNSVSIDIRWGWGGEEALPDEFSDPCVTSCNPDRQE